MSSGLLFVGRSASCFCIVLLELKTSRMLRAPRTLPFSSLSFVLLNTTDKSTKMALVRIYYFRTKLSAAEAHTATSRLISTDSICLLYGLGCLTYLGSRTAGLMQTSRKQVLSLDFRKHCMMSCASHQRNHRVKAKTD